MVSVMKRGKKIPWLSLKPLGAKAYVIIQMFLKKEVGSEGCFSSGDGGAGSCIR